MRSTTAGVRFFKARMFWLVCFSVFSSVCVVVPAPSRTLLPLTVGLPELAAWLVAWNLVVAALAFRFLRRAAPVVAVCLVISAWPLTQIPGIERTMANQFPGPAREGERQPFVLLDCFRGIPAQRIEPERLPLGMLLYRPTGAHTVAAVIDIYGGAWQRGEPRDDRQFDSYLASRGYAVFAIEYRHAPKFQFPAQLEDVRAAVAFVSLHAGEYHIDRDRIVICGRSSGAHLALLAAYERGPVVIRSVIGFYGPTDLAAGYRDLPSPDPIHVRSVLEAFLGGPPDSLAERYREASPVAHVRMGLPPTLLIQGGRDHIVKLVFARELHRKLQDAGNRAILLEIPWAEHAFDAVFSGAGSQLALHYIERFLRETVGE